MRGDRATFNKVLVRRIFEDYPTANARQRFLGRKKVLKFGGAISIVLRMQYCPVIL